MAGKTVGFALFWGSLLVWGLFLAPGASALQAGASRLELELPSEIPLAGYVHRLGRNASGTHDPIKVRALYLETEDTAIALVSADLHSITPELRQRVLDMAPAAISENHIILTATHTHHGPGGLSSSWFARRYTGRHMPELIDSVAEQIADAIRQAMDAKKRATIGYAVSTQESLTRNMYTKNGLRDSQVGVIRVDDSDGNAIALLGSMSAHPTMNMGSNTLEISADFPGYFCDRLEELSHKDTVAFFLNGTTGDQICVRREGRNEWDQAAYIGNELAVLVKSVANSIDCKEHPISINYQKKTVPENVAGRFISREVLIQTLEISRLIVSFIPGEPFAVVQQTLSNIARRRGYAAHITVGLANDYLMDLAPADIFPDRGEFPGFNLVGPSGAEWVMDSVQTIMRRGEHRPQLPPVITVPELIEIPGGYRITTTGDLRDRTRQLGAALRPMFETVWADSIPGAVQRASRKLDLLLWGNRVGINPTPIAIPLMADRDRGHLTPDELKHIQWLARGSELPFDQIHLMRHLLSGASRPEIIAVTGARTREDGQLLGTVFTAPPGTPVIVQYHQSKQGRDYVSVGSAWDSVLRIGINDSNVAIAVVEDRADLDYSGALEHNTSLEGAQRSLMRTNPVDAQRVLMVDRPANAAALLEYRTEWQPGKLDSTVWMNSPQNDLEFDDSTLSRSDLEALLRDSAAKQLTKTLDGEYPVVCAVILEPGTASAYVAISSDGKFPESYQQFSARGDDR